jgi:hypothetical protein
MARVAIATLTISLGERLRTTGIGTERFTAWESGIASARPTA